MAFEQPVSRRTFMAVTGAAAAATVLQGSGVQGAPCAKRRFALVGMSYSLNSFMPIEGYRLAFNGTRGRLEIRDFERQPFEVAHEVKIADLATL